MPRELRVESGPEFEQCRQAPSDDHLPLGRRQRPGDDLQQRRLAGAVAAEEADGLAAAHLERHVAQGPELAMVGADAGGQELAQPVARTLVNLVDLADVLRNDDQVLGQRGWRASEDIGETLPQRLEQHPPERHHREPGAEICRDRPG